MTLGSKIKKLRNNKGLTQKDLADKVFVTLAEGTGNMLESGETFSDEALEDGTGGVIYSHDDLTINGTGSLTISGGPEHGIEVNDSLVISVRFPLALR